MDTNTTDLNFKCLLILFKCRSKLIIMVSTARASRHEGKNRVFDFPYCKESLGALKRFE